MNPLAARWARCCLGYKRNLIAAVWADGCRLFVRHGPLSILRHHTDAVCPPEGLGHRGGAKRKSLYQRTRACISELPRIPIPRTTVNKGKKEDRSYDARPFS